MLGYVEDEEGNCGLYLGNEEGRGRKRDHDSFLPIQQVAKEAEVPERYKKARHSVLRHTLDFLLSWQTYAHLATDFMKSWGTYAQLAGNFQYMKTSPLEILQVNTETLSLW